MIIIHRRVRRGAPPSATAADGDLPDQDDNWAQTSLPARSLEPEDALRNPRQRPWRSKMCVSQAPSFQMSSDSIFLWTCTNIRVPG
jgi:hypothetical protein